MIQIMCPRLQNVQYLIPEIVVSSFNFLIFKIWRAILLQFHHCPVSQGPREPQPHRRDAIPSTVTMALVPEVRHFEGQHRRTFASGEGKLLFSPRSPASNVEQAQNSPIFLVLAVDRVWCVSEKLNLPFKLSFLLILRPFHFSHFHKDLLVNYHTSLLSSFSS